ncbi:MAG: hypothetical protein Q9164_001861 [Protoblastenia rupestris]
MRRRRHRKQGLPGELDGETISKTTAIANLRGDAIVRSVYELDSMTIEDLRDMLYDIEETESLSCSEMSTSDPMWSNPELPALSPSDSLLAELDTSSEVSPAELFSTETAREPNCGDEQSKPRTSSPILDVVSPTSRAVLPISDPQQPSSIDQTICVDECTCVRRSTASAVNCANVILQPKEDRAEAVVSAKTVDEGAKDIQHRRKRAKADPVLLWKPQSLLLYETPELLTLSAFKRSSKNLENSGCVSAESHVEEMYALASSFDKQELINVLKNGRIMKDCSSYLDDIEHTGIIQRNRALLPDHFAWYAREKRENITHMLGHFIKPLKTQNGIEALQNVIVDTEFQVSAGLLRSPREVEVALTSSAKARRKQSRNQGVIRTDQNVEGGRTIQDGGQGILVLNDAVLRRTLNQVQM